MPMLAPERLPLDADMLAEAARVTAGLEAERRAPQIPMRDLSPFARGNAGIPYAFTFEGSAPGPHVAVTCLAHGNEPGGLEAVIALVESDVRPVRGSLSLIVCNVAAYQARNGVDPYGTRFVEEDFNRVWDDALLDSPHSSVERDRAREIRPLVASADILLDLHATPYEATPYHVLRPGSRAVDLAGSIGPRTRFHFQQGSAHSPTLANYKQFRAEDGTAVGLTVECGLFFSRSSQEVALTTILELLHLQGMIPHPVGRGMMIPLKDAPERDLSIETVQPTQTAVVRFLSRPGDFRAFAAGEIAAFDGDSPILAPFEGAIPVWVKQTMVAGEQAFMWAREGKGGSS